MFSFAPAIPKTTLIVLGILWVFLGTLILASQIAFPAVVTLKWETESEFDTAGFNVLKSASESGNYIKINDQLIASQADPAAGASYEYKDSDVVPGQTYYYRLEDVEFDSTTSTHEVLTVEAPARPSWIIAIAAVCILIGFGMLLVSFNHNKKKSNESTTNTGQVA